MSTSHIKVRDVKSYSEGFNKGFEAAETNRKLTSITASIIKSVFYQQYHDSFYMGVADGWQHSFNKKKQQLKSQAKDFVQNRQPPPHQEQQPQRTQQHISEQERAARLAARQAQIEQHQQKQRDDQELDR